MDIDLLDNLLFAMVRTGTPLLLVALGELVCERSGVLNLGQEGMMLFGAVIGFMVAFSSGSLWLGVLLAVLAGMLLAALFAGVALYLNANQVACGLALTIFGVGLSSFVGAAWVGKPLQGFAPLALPVLGELPLLGRMLFAQDALVYLSLALFAAVAWMLLRSRAGLVLQAVGENPQLAGVPRAARCLVVRPGQHPAPGGPGDRAVDSGQPAGDAALCGDHPGAGPALPRCPAHPAVCPGFPGPAVEGRALTRAGSSISCFNYLYILR